MIQFIKNLFKKKGKVDLQDFTDLRFEKNYYGEYKVCFFNPIYKKYWILPTERVAIHGYWSFNKSGSYGAYDIGVLTCKHGEIEIYRNKFKQLSDIQEYFDKLNRKYYEFKLHEEKINNLPQTL